MYLLMILMKTMIAMNSHEEALKSLETVHAFLLQQENASEQIKLVNKIERYINVKKVNSSKQTTIDSYFNILKYNK